MGCFEKDVRKRMGNVVYIQRCNKSIQNLATNIGMKCWKNENRKDIFVEKVIAEIKRSIQNPKVISVHIVAHSYGGLVSSEAARHLTQHPLAYKLNIITFGSIDIVDPRLVVGIKIKQYMNRGDVALRCNRMSRKGIIWLKHKKVSNVIDEWKKHMEYPLNETRDSIIKRLNSR